MTYVINNMTYVMLIYISPQFYHSETTMLLPCEIAAKTIIPSIKATIAAQLTEIHGLKQSEVANLLGITQSAVSKYTTGRRGYILKIEEIDEVKPLIAGITNALTSGKPDRTQLLLKLCQTCTIIREKGLMCEFCQKADPRIKRVECTFCLNYYKDDHI